MYYWLVTKLDFFLFCRSFAKRARIPGGTVWSLGFVEIPGAIICPRNLFLLGIVQSSGRRIDKSLAKWIAVPVRNRFIDPCTPFQNLAILVERKVPFFPNHFRHCRRSFGHGGNSREPKINSRTHG